MSFHQQQRALITGASSGIGKATALAFARAGIHVALLSRSLEKLEAVAETIRQSSEVDVAVYPVDLARVDRVRERIGKIAAEFAPVDILINNAGMGYTKPLIDTPLADWQRVLDLNLTGAFECIQGILPMMRDRGTGTIVNVVSIAGKQAFPGWGAYCTSKFGLMGLTKALAAEERANGIRVTAVCPGAVNSPIWDTETVNADFDRSKMLTPESVAESILQTIQMPSEATIEEVTLMPSAGVL